MTNLLMKSVTLAALLAAGSAANAATLVDDMAYDGGGMYRGVHDTISVDYEAAKAGSAALAFQLFGARSVDGYGNGWDDLYTVALNGTTIFSGYFNLGGGGSDKVVTNKGLTYSASTGAYYWGGAVDVAGNVDLRKGLNTFTFSFTAEGPNNNGDQGVGDESWAVNAATITPASVPLPAAMPLMAAALAGLGALGLRRRKA